MPLRNVARVLLGLALGVALGACSYLPEIDLSKPIDY